MGCVAEPQGERRSFVYFGRYMDRSIVTVHDPFDDGQSDPGAFNLFPRAVNTIESLKDIGDVFFRNAHSSVAHFKISEIKILFQRQEDLPAFRSEFNGIVNEVDHDLIK